MYSNNNLGQMSTLWVARQDVGVRKLIESNMFEF